MKAQNMTYRVCEQHSPGGTRWEVRDQWGHTAGVFDSMAAAWRWIDRHEDGAVSSSESRHQWGWDQYANGE